MGVIEDLSAAGPVLLDGAWGTELQRQGLPVGAAPDPWNIDRPDKVAEVAAAYVTAGSRIILTNTFGASRITLARHGLDARAYAINEAGGAISVRAAAGRALVFGSIGPIGKMLSMGEVSATDVSDAFQEQADAMAASGVSGFVVETMTDVGEAALAVRAAARTGLPVAASMTFGAGKTGDRTMMGVTPEQAAEELGGAGASIIGSNCGQGAAQMLPICARLRAASGMPVWAKPNAGMPALVDGRSVYTQTAQEFALEVRALVEAGAMFVGGCCGSGPEYIRALAAALTDALSRN